MLETIGIVALAIALVVIRNIIIIRHRKNKK